MANANQIKLLNDQEDRLQKISLDKIFRPTLGPVSMPESNRKQVENLIARFQSAISVADSISNTVAQQIRNIFDAFNNQLDSLANQSDDAYVAQKVPFQDQLDSLSEQLSNIFPSVTQALIERSGILDSERENYSQEMLENVRADIRSQLPSLVEEEAGRAIKEARELAKSIESRARNTAAGISIAEAQAQFGDAIKVDGIQLGVWGLLGFVGLIVFFVVAYNYSSEVKNLPHDWTWQFGYLTALHATILAALGTITGYSLRNLRANLHMLNHNLHRRRITNSIEAFVQAAQTSEQRDMILMRLVDSVSAFGQSGLVTTDSDSIQPKLSIDTISHALGSSQKGS